MVQGVDGAHPGGRTPWVPHYLRPQEEVKRLWEDGGGRRPLRQRLAPPLVVKVRPLLAVTAAVIAVAAVGRRGRGGVVTTVVAQGESQCDVGGR